MSMSAVLGIMAIRAACAGSQSLAGSGGRYDHIGDSFSAAAGDSYHQSAGSRAARHRGPGPGE